MTQYIELKRITCYAYHGVMEQERKVGNTYTIDLKLHTDFSKAMETDNVNDTINYASVYAIVREEMAIPSCLLEHVAGRIVRRLSETFSCLTATEIRLAKRNPPLSGDVFEAAVCIQKD